MGARDVILGTKYALHVGLHGPLVAAPPPGVYYLQRDGIHEVTLPSRTATLFSSQAVSEAINFGEGPEVVHSAQWPVIGRRAWVVDYDDFGTAAFLSHFGLTQIFRRAERDRTTRSEHFTTLLHLRFANLIRALAHPSCKAVFTHTAVELARIRRWLTKCTAEREAEAAAGKLQCVYPAVPSAAASDVAAKWRDGTRLRLVYCGTGFETKRGLWALRAFATIAGHPNLDRFFFVGDVPDAIRQHYQPMGTIEFLSGLTHDRMLQLLSQSHVLIHPSENESVGAVILESIAAGLCVVAHSGMGMEQLEDWFSDGGAYLLSPQRHGFGAPQAEAAFKEAVLALLDAPDRARAHGLCNYSKATDGRLSIARRHQILVEAYAASPACSAVTASTFLLPPDSQLLRCTSSYLVDQRHEYLSGLPDSGRQITTAFEL